MHRCFPVIMITMSVNQVYCYFSIDVVLSDRSYKSHNRQWKRRTSTQCNEGTFRYLGFTISSDARCDTEIKKRTALSKDTFTKMKSISTNRNIRIYTKINPLKAYVWSALLHGCECWTLTKDLERGLEAVEMCYIRWIMGISWTEKKSNEEVMEMAWYKRSLLNTIRKGQLQVF